MLRVESAPAPSSRSSLIVASTILSAVSDMTAGPPLARTFAACDGRMRRAETIFWVPFGLALLLPLFLFAEVLSCAPFAGSFFDEAARLELEVEGISYWASISMVKLFRSQCSLRRSP
jgi:hypothetical protein